MGEIISEWWATSFRNRGRLHSGIRSNGHKNSSGSLAMLAVIRRASSRVSKLGRRSPPRLVLEIDIRKLLSVVVAHDETCGGPGRREAALSFGQGDQVMTPSRDEAHGRCDGRHKRAFFHWP